MNITQKGILTLIKSALEEKSYPLPEGFSINEAYDLIIKHGIIMTAYDGAARCKIPSSEPAMQKLFKIYIANMLRSEKQMEAVNELYSAFDKNGIDYLPLKGCNMKDLYPKPELRVMGDADILIRKEQYGKIKNLVESLGFFGGEENGHHYVWISKKLHLELHTMPIPENYITFYRYYKDGWDLAKKTETNKYVYSKEDSFVFLFTHFAKHYLEGGIGLRHASDIFVYLENFKEMDMEYVESELEKLGLLLFFRNFISVLEYWFGNKEPDEAAEIISDFIFSSGNWGDFETHAISNGARNSFGKKHKFEKIRYFLRTVFPSVQVIGPKYKWVKKIPFLLPIAWVQRWLDVLFFRRERIGRKIEYIEAIDDKKVDAHRKNLEKAGFRF